MISPSQAWSILSRHARQDIENIRLQELAKDDDRVSSLVAVYNSDRGMLIADLSRQRMTLETLNHLLRLAQAIELRKFIRQLAWGPSRQLEGSSSNRSKTTRFADGEVGADAALSHLQSSSYHLAMRVPAGEGNTMYWGKKNVLEDIHSEWTRLERLSDCIRRGQLRGCTNSMIRTVLVIGRGVPIATLKFVYTALMKDEQGVLASRMGLASPVDSATRLRRSLVGSSTPSPSSTPPGRTIRFLTTVDPVAAASTVADLDPASTLVVSIALNGNEETSHATKTIKSWLLQHLASNRRADSVLAKHIMLVTASVRVASVINKPESVHMIPEHSRCEAFCNFSPAVLLVRQVNLVLLLQIPPT